MATIIFTLSARTDANDEREVRIRFMHGKIDQQTRTGIFINPGKPVKINVQKGNDIVTYDSFDYFNTQSGSVTIPNLRGVLTPDKVELDKYLNDKKDSLSNLKKHIIDVFKKTPKNIITAGWLKDIVERYNFPEPCAQEEEPVIIPSFFDTFDEFLVKRKLSDVRERGFMVLKRALQRYELFVYASRQTVFKWNLDQTTCETIKDFEQFLLDEHSLYDDYKDIYDEFPAITDSRRKSHKPQPRGMNYISGLFKRMRAFINWCIDVEKTSNNMFKNYESTPELYGSPIYISIEERNKIYETDLSLRPDLAIQRDIFVFQAMIGCRIGDLYKMTKHSVINGAIEYIPRKTKDGHPITVRVPLNDTAMAILKQYESDDARLLPFISEQKYNNAIKKIFEISGITRMVTVLNPTTRVEEKRPIYEVASSHMARRTFIGNIYKKVKDPNLVGALSGHQEGSTAFARYRDIDEEMKQELVKLLE